MFFILSKTLNILIMPLNWVIGFALYAAFGKNVKWKRRSLLSAIVLLIFFTNHFFFNQVMKAWEYDTITMDQLQDTFDIGILLGGYSNPNIIPGHDRHNFGPSASRFTNTLELYHQGNIRKILLTGGSGRILDIEPSEALLVRDFLIRIGIPAEDIIIDPDSRNTRENAVFTKKILDEKYPNASCLLITSAFHMRRAMRCFDKVGIEYTPFSVDFHGERTRFVPESFILPDRLGFFRWEMMIKEWVGIVFYKLRGYI